MKINSNTLLIIISAVIVALGAYWFFRDAEAEPVLSVDVTQSETQAQFQTLVSELQPISFKTEILSDARFLSLRDLTTPIAPESAGRLDPFAPVAGVSAP